VRWQTGTDAHATSPIIPTDMMMIGQTNAYYYLLLDRHEPQESSQVQYRPGILMTFCQNLLFLLFCRALMCPSLLCAQRGTLQRRAKKEDDECLDEMLAKPRVFDIRSILRRLLFLSLQQRGESINPPIIRREEGEDWKLEGSECMIRSRASIQVVAHTL
jgi:hypothetical protein